MCTAFLISSTFLFAQVPDEVASSLKKGDARQLSGYFNANVELVVLDKDNVYSKAQAQQIVSNFFADHVPEDFTVIHKGGKEAKYVIGTLKTSNGNFPQRKLKEKTDHERS